MLPMTILDLKDCSTKNILFVYIYEGAVAFAISYNFKPIKK